MDNKFWFKFQYKDWLADTRHLSLTARGLLLELIIYMESNQISKIRLTNRLTNRLTGGLTEEIELGLAELREFRILDFEVDEEGIETITSRKIAKRIEREAIYKKNGEKGGNPKLKKEPIRLTKLDNQTHNQKDNLTPNSIFISNNNIEYRDKEGGVGETLRDLDFPKTEGMPIEPFSPMKPIEFYLPKMLVDEIRLEQVMMSLSRSKLNITLTQVKEYLNMFATTVADEKYNSYNRAWGHFTNWIPKQIKRENEQPTKQKRGFGAWNDALNG